MKRKLHFQRFEFKYIISRDTAERIQKYIAKKMLPDPYLANTKKDYYFVTSLYLDSPDFQSFHEKIYGAKARRKFRLRAYEEELSEDAEFFLEIKRKYDMVVIKDRVYVKPHHLKSIMSGKLIDLGREDLEDVEKKVLAEYTYTRCHHHLKPAVVVRYKRLPFIGKVDSKFRMTFDFDLESVQEKYLDLGPSAYVPVLPWRSVIMEVKFNNLLPSWFRDILYEYYLQREPYSKYCQSVIRHQLVKSYY